MINKESQTPQQKIEEMEFMLKEIEQYHFCRFDISGGYDRNSEQYQKALKSTDEEAIRIYHAQHSIFLSFGFN